MEDTQRFVLIPKGALIISAILHGCFVAFMVSEGVFENLSFLSSHPLKTIQAYQDFIQVDVVAMPEQLRGEKMDVSLPISKKPGVPPLVKETPTPAEPTLVIPKETLPPLAQKKDEKKAAKEKEAKEKMAAEEAKREAAKKAAMEALESTKHRESALKKITEDLHREAAIKNLSKKGKAGTGRAKLAGNKLSKGTSVSGAMGSAYDQYAALLRKIIKEHFNVYTWQQKKSLVAVVFIELYPDGRVREKKLLTRSPDPMYNSAIMEAIDASEPLPVPEDTSILRGGMQLEFRSKE